MQGKRFQYIVYAVMKNINGQYNRVNSNIIVIRRSILPRQLLNEVSDVIPTKHCTHSTAKTI